MSKVAKPPFVRDGEWYLPEVCEADFENFLVPLRHVWIIDKERVGWLDITATWEWFETGECSLNELCLLTKMLDGIIGKGLRTKRYKKMLREEEEINQKILAVCRRLIAKAEYAEEERSNVVQFRN
jgi:hypothetical protein